MAQTSRSNPAIGGAVPTQFSPEIRTEFGRSEEGRWIERYGFVEHSIGKPDDESMEDGRNSRRKQVPQGGQGEAGACSRQRCST